MDMAQRTVETVKDIQAAMKAAAQQLPLLSVKQPPALEAVYDGLPKDVVATCEQAHEQARGRLRDAFITELRKVHQALAPSGRFKDWCAAVGINYNTAKSKVGRAGKKEQAGGAHPHTRPPASKPHKLAFAFTNEEDQQRAWTSVQRVIKARKLEREAALLYISDVFEGRVLMLAADAAAITHVGEAA